MTSTFKRGDEIVNRHNRPGLVERVSENDSEILVRYSHAKVWERAEDLDYAGWRTPNAIDFRAIAAGQNALDSAQAHADVCGCRDASQHMPEGA